MPDYLIKISIPADAGGATDSVAAATGGTGRLAQAAARTPDASLESLAASARQVEANAAAACQPMAALAREAESSLANITAGFGSDFSGEMFGSLEAIGRAFETMASGSAATSQSAGPDQHPDLDQAPPAGGTPADHATDAPAASNVKPIDVSSNVATASPAKPPPRQDANTAEREPADLPAVQARGEDEVTDQPTRQRDLRVEPRRLQNPHGEPTRAGAPDTERTSPRQAGRGQPEAELAGRQHPASSRHGRGGRDPFTIHGYSDGGDPGGGLRTGGLSTGHLGGSGESSAADALASAPTNIPAFPPAPRGPLFAPGADPVGGLFTGGMPAPLFSARTAAAQLGPMTGESAGPTPTAAASPGSPASIDTQAATAAATSAAREAAETAKSFREFTQAFGDFSTAFQQLQKDVENLKGQVSNRS